MGGVALVSMMLLVHARLKVKSRQLEVLRSEGKRNPAKVAFAAVASSIAVISRFARPIESCVLLQRVCSPTIAPRSLAELHLHARPSIALGAFSLPPRGRKLALLPCPRASALISVA